MPDTMIEEMLMIATGMIDMINTKIMMGNVISDTTWITPPVSTQEGRTMASMKTGPDKVTGTKSI